MIGNILGAAAPIAAGYFTGGAGFGLGAQIAAGALTGAGIAALSGQDVLAGGFTGGLGGLGGGSMANAAQAAKATAQGSLTDAAANELVTKQAIQQGGTSVGSGITGSTGQLGANLGQVNVGEGLKYTAGGGSGITGGTVGQSYAPDFMATANMPVPEASFGTDYGFKDIARELGGGDTTVGAGKMALTASSPVLATFEEETPTFDELRKDKYDPYKSLDLDIDTGIGAALGRDTGLRLLSGGGEITDDLRSSYGITPQYRNTGVGIAGLTNKERVPVMGIVDVGGKFVSDPKGDISDVQFEEKYLQNQVDAEKNQNQQSGGMGPQFGPGAPAEIPEAAQKALTNLAGGIASAQRSQAANQIDRLGGLAGGGYLETGGRIGDGMSDDIKARINNQQEARLSDGEFVVPADVVSHLGNGSSDAGAKRLYEMMDKVRQARTGTKQQGKEINPERFMPA